MSQYGWMPVDVNLDERWVKLGGPLGTVVQIWGTREPTYDRNAMGYFRVAITGDGLQAEAGVGTMEHGRPPLRSFFRGLADDWKGETLEATWEAIEHDLTIDARRDPLGYVLLTFTLRESYMPRAWQVRGMVQLEAGEEMERVADTIDILISEL
jgi:hypothetical protein